MDKNKEHTWEAYIHFLNCFTMNIIKRIDTNIQMMEYIRMFNVTQSS